MALTRGATGVTVNVRFNHFDKIAKYAPETASNLIKKIADDFVTLATDYVPVDTGNLKNSGDQEPKWNPGDQTALVSWNAEYAAFVNFGTIYMKPRSPGPSELGYASRALRDIEWDTQKCIDETLKAWGL